jgi:hypothetical protein
MSPIEDEKIKPATRLINAMADKISDKRKPRSGMEKLRAPLLEFVKVTGALVPGGGGLLTALTGYQQIAELKTGLKTLAEAPGTPPAQAGKIKSFQFKISGEERARLLNKGGFGSALERFSAPIR